MKRLLPLSALALLAACTTGTDYRRPEHAAINRPSTQGAFVSGNSAAFRPEPLPDRWWQLYKDPVLDRLVEEALASNTDLRVAAANIHRAGAALEAVRDGRKPQFGIEAGPALAQRSGEEWLQPNAQDPFFVYSGGLSVSYQLDLAGQIRRAVEAAEADEAAVAAAYDTVRVTVVAQTTSAYIDACAAGRELEVARRAVALQARSTELTHRMVAGGRGISSDVSRSSAQEATVRASVPALLAAKQVALYRLAVLTGKPPAEFDRTVAQCTAEPTLDRPIPIGDGAALLKRRPDIRSAEFQLRAANARIGVATADLYPRISFGASAGSVGLIDRFFSGDTFKFSLGPLLSWEFPNRGRARANIAAAEATSEAAYARFDGVVLSALRETESALTVYARELDRHVELSRARADAARAATDMETLYRVGRQGYLPVLDAQRTLIQADQALAASQTRLADNQVKLFLALGGGWEDGAGARDNAAGGK